jgi:membrane-bound metal-dependent hydrolase YbcI (DUF457 family)
MFLGHYGLALAAKRASPRTSLGMLFFAAQFLDELWPILLLAGLEQVRVAPGLMKTNALDFVSYPWSHSLVMAVVWSVLVGSVYLARRHDRRAALIVGGLVLSHWLLDVPMHRPDLPLWPGGGPRLGAGLWNSLPATVAIELGLFGFGLFVYLRGTRARDGAGRWALWSLVAVLLLIFLSGLGGAPPPSARAVAVVTLGLWLFVPWAAWADRRRDPVATMVG